MLNTARILIGVPGTAAVDDDDAADADDVCANVCVNALQ